MAELSSVGLGLAALGYARLGSVEAHLAGLGSAWLAQHGSAALSYAWLRLNRMDSAVLGLAEIGSQ